MGAGAERRHVIRSATVVNAALLQRTGELGVVAPGAYADLLLVDGDPLQDISVLGARATTSTSSSAPARSS